MITRRLGTAAFLGLVACGGVEEPATGENASALAHAAYRYTCRTPSPMVIDKKTMAVTVSTDHLRFVGEYGENLGERDRSYRAPASNPDRIRFDGFAWGEDCSLKLVMDRAALQGDADPELRVQCAGDDEFRQDVYRCESPTAVSLHVPTPPPPPPPPPTPGPQATRWTCNVTDGRVLDNRVEMRIDEDVIALTAEGLEHVGTRDRDYRSQSGNYVAYEDFDYGGDCTLTAVVESKVLTPSTTSAVVKVRCRGDSFVEDRYRCTKAR